MDPLGPPRTLVARACDRYGRVAVVQWCVRLLLDEPAQPTDPDISWLGGHHGWTPEWQRVWAARALSYIYTPDAAAAVGAGLTDTSWRVQEMTCNLIGAQSLGQFRAEVARLTEHETERVHKAATRALALLE